MKRNKSVSILRIIGYILVVFLVTTLSACNNIDVEPLENPNVDLYEVIYEDDFMIYRKLEMFDGVYNTIGYEYGIGNDTVILGQPHRFNYMVEYEGEYYDFIDFNQFQLVSVSLLEELEII